MGREQFLDVLSPTFSNLVNKRRDLGQVSYLSYKGEHAWNDVDTDSEVKQTSNPQEERDDGWTWWHLRRLLATNSSGWSLRASWPHQFLVSSSHWLFGHGLSPSRAQGCFPVFLLSTLPTESPRCVAWMVLTRCPFSGLLLRFQRQALSTSRDQPPKVSARGGISSSSSCLSAYFSFSCFLSSPALIHTVENCQASSCLSDGLCPSVDVPLTQSW